MRIDELRLLAFGPFTDALVKLRSEAPRLEVIYGPNEAGKSTTLRALSGLFFGIPARTGDAHLHTKTGALRIGARLVGEDGAVVDVIRRKGSKNTLLGPDETPVDEAVLSRLLGGVGAEQFTRMFGLDHETLREGAAELLASGGDLGESLFGASLGGGIHEALRQLDDDAKALYAPRAKNAPLNRAIKAHKDAAAAVRDAGFTQAAYEKEARDLRDARATLDALQEQRLALRTESGRAARALRVIPLLRKRAAAEAQRAEIGPVPRIPADAPVQREAATRALREGQAKLDQLRGDVARLEEERSAVPAAGPLGAVPQEVLEELRDNLGNHRRAYGDLPKREAERDNARREAGRILARVSPDTPVDDARGLIPGTVDRAAINELADAHGKVASRVDDARRELGRAEDLVHGLDAGAGGAVDSPGQGPREAAMLVLRGAAKAARGGEETSLRLAEGEATLAELSAVADRLAAALPGFTGDAAGASTLAVPDTAAVQRDAEQARALDGAVATARGVRDEAQRALEQADRALAADDVQGAVPTESQLDEERRERQRLWRSIRSRLTGGGATPDPGPYEESVERADRTADRLRQDAERLANRAGLVARREDERRGVAAAEAAITRAESARDEHRSAVVARWAALGVETPGAAEMPAWLARHGDVVRAYVKVEEQRAANATLRARVEAMAEDLRRALEEAGEEVPPGAAHRELFERVDGLVEADRDRNAATKAAREQQAKARRALAERRRELEEREADHAAWRDRWGQRVAVLGLDESASADEARALLNDLTELERVLGVASAAADRIEKIRRDAARFEASIADLVRDHAPDLSELDLAARASTLHQRIRDAHGAREKLQRSDADLANRRELIARLEGEVELAERALAALSEAAGAKTVDELIAAEDRIVAARAKDDAIAEVTRELVEAGEGRTIEELAAETGALDADQLGGRLEEIEAELRDLDEQVTATAQQITTIDNTIAARRQGASAADAASEAAAALSEVQDAAHRYVRLRLAAKILRAEIDRYRDDNQAPILTQANEFFPRLTLGRYQALKVGINAKDEPVLECVRADGEVVGVDGLSDGTKDQLYLALRLASLLRFAAHNQPMPLILDDCLVHFDDDRARAALGVLGEVAEVFQVLFFTHHQRLVELAREAVPADRLGVTILGAPS